MKQYTEKEVKDLIKWFKNNNILLVCGDMIGDVELPLLEEEWLIDELIEGYN